MVEMQNKAKLNQLGLERGLKLSLEDFPGGVPWSRCKEVTPKFLGAGSQGQYFDLGSRLPGS